MESAGLSEEREFPTVHLLRALRARHYHFITPTPATHARVVARPHKQIARELRDVFGWSLPFRRETIDAEIVALMEAAGVLHERGDLSISAVRVSSLDEDLFLHSAYPTTQANSVFFGPDSYRFSAFLKAELPRLAPRNHLVDIGAGTGVGAIVASRCLPEMLQLTLTDINQTAIGYAMANVLGMENHGRGGYFGFQRGSGLENIGHLDIPDIIIANPPYIADPLHRAYRDGGDMHGAGISLDWATQAAERLERSGTFLLYTGSAIVDGEDRFKAALHDVLSDFDVSYRELDPDVFGEELEREDYADVERIAVVGVVAVKR